MLPLIALSVRPSVRSRDSLAKLASGLMMCCAVLCCAALCCAVLCCKHAYYSHKGAGGAWTQPPLRAELNHIESFSQRRCYGSNAVMVLLTVYHSNLRFMFSLLNIYIFNSSLSHYL